MDLQEDVVRNLPRTLTPERAFDRDEMMTQTTHDPRKRRRGGYIGVATAHDGHPHGRGQDGKRRGSHLHAAVYA